MYIDVEYIFRIYQHEYYLFYFLSIGIIFDYNSMKVLFCDGRLNKMLICFIASIKIYIILIA